MSGSARNPLTFHRDWSAIVGSKYFANFLNRLSLKRIEDDYAGLF
jgi:hypothetical protein